MKTHLVRPIARLILLAFAATLISCANQPTPGSRVASHNIVDPWRLHHHHNHHHCKKL